MYFVENLKNLKKFKKKVVFRLNIEVILYFVFLNCIMVVKFYLKFYY